MKSLVEVLHFNVSSTSLQEFTYPVTVAGFAAVEITDKFERHKNNNS